VSCLSAKLGFFTRVLFSHSRYVSCLGYVKECQRAGISRLRSSNADFYPLNEHVASFLGRTGTCGRGLFGLADSLETK
jgi:hypothetical protein